MQSFDPSTPPSSIHWSLIRLKGPDVIDYLHRLTTVNLKFMKAGDGCPGFLLSPQAKIKSYFYLWVITKDKEPEVLLEFDAGHEDKWKTELMALIEQFHFAEKFTLTEITDLQTLWLFPEKEEARLKTSLDPNGARLFHHGSIEFGHSWITAWGTPEQIATLQKADTTAINEKTLNEWRITAGQPWVDSEITDNSNPLEIGLHQAVAGNKGCYPGQEVIEKIISLGAPARRLVKIAGEGPPPEVGALVNTADPGKTEAGRVTSVTQIENGYEALALVKKLYAQEGALLTFGSEKAATVVKVAPYL